MAYSILTLLLLALLTTTIIATQTPTDLAPAAVTAEPDPLLNFKPTLGTCIDWCSGASFTGSCAKNFCKDANVCVNLGTSLGKRGEEESVDQVNYGEHRYGVKGNHTEGEHHNPHAHANHTVEGHHNPHAHANHTGGEYHNPHAHANHTGLQERQLSGIPLTMTSISMGGSTSCMIYKKAGCHLKDEHLRVGAHHVDDLGVWGWGGSSVRSFACVRPN